MFWNDAIRLSSDRFHLPLVCLLARIICMMWDLQNHELIFEVLLKNIKRNISKSNESWIGSTYVY